MITGVDIAIPHPTDTTGHLSRYGALPLRLESWESFPPGPDFRGSRGLAWTSGAGPRGPSWTSTGGRADYAIAIVALIVFLWCSL